MSVDAVDAEWPEYTDPATLSPREFCDRHDLIPELTPFAHRSYEPWSILNTIADELDSFHPSASTFTHSYIFDDPNTTNNWWVAATEAGYRVLGAWPYQDRSGGATRWVTPHYDHERALAPGDFDSRGAELRECAAAGTLTVEDVAPRFDLSKAGLKRWLERHDVPWGKRRRAGQRRLARTIATAAAWRDETIKSHLELLPVEYTAAEYWIQADVRESEWSVPDDPSRTGGFE